MLSLTAAKNDFHMEVFHTTNDNKISLKDPLIHTVYFTGTFWSLSSKSSHSFEVRDLQLLLSAEAPVCGNSTLQIVLMALICDFSTIQITITHGSEIDITQSK